uniref:CARMIL pleckstrin homology domain-containing protein n=2 Tax=Arcella intermedia TaxID=1963864 RepID=A0A6B2KY22_9EUKA
MRGGKLEYDFHLIEITDIESPTKNQVTFTWQSTTPDASGKPIRSGKPNSVTLHPICYASCDIDVIVDWVRKQWEYNFIGMPPEEAFKFIIEPTQRKEIMAQRFRVEDKDAGCGGLVRTYISVCDWMMAPIQEDLIWDLENYFYTNSLKTFKVFDLLQKDKWPCIEFQTIIYSLKYNLWFQQLDCTGCALGNESVVLIAEMMRHNKTIQKLCLPNANASNRAVAALCESFDANTQGLAINHLDLSGNSMDSKTVSALANSIVFSLGKISELNVSNAKITKLGLIFEALVKSTSLMSLVRLDVSQNKFDGVASKAMGGFLMQSNVIEYLNVSGSSPVWSNLVEGMQDKELIQKNKSLASLDLSHNPTKGKFQTELVQFINRVPFITTLNIADTQLAPDTIFQILQTAKFISSLDLSENDLTDEGIVTLMKLFYKSPSPLSVKKLYMNRMFKSRSKMRLKAMKNTAKAIIRCDIRDFQINNSKLKGDILDLIFGLLNVKHLELLDVSGNQSGDPLALALAKLLQHNRTILTIYWDGNEITERGLKSILLGLQRNHTIKHMPLPLLDLASILRKENVDTEGIIDLTKKIQLEMLEKSTKNVDRGMDVEPPPTVALKSPTKSSTLPLEEGDRQSRTLLTVNNTVPNRSSHSSERRSLHQRSASRRKKTESIDINKAALVFGRGSEDNEEISEEPQPTEAPLSPPSSPPATSPTLVHPSEASPSTQEAFSLTLSTEVILVKEKSHKKLQVPLAPASRDRSLSKNGTKRSKTKRARPSLSVPTSPLPGSEKPSKEHSERKSLLLDAEDSEEQSQRKKFSLSEELNANSPVDGDITINEDKKE